MSEYPPMSIDEIKALINTYRAAGRSRESTVEIVSALPMNGADSEAFEYIETAYKEITGEQPEIFNLTDSGNAEYFISLYGQLLRYDHSRARWLNWDQHYWRPDTDKGITRLAVKSVRDRYKKATNITDLDTREKVAKWTISSEQRSRIDSLLAMAKDFKPIADQGDGWDSNGWLFCVENGVIDLKNGEIRKGKQSDMITMQTPITYDKDAVCPIWDKFLDDTTGGDKELIKYLQRAAGYTMTGETKQQIWFFLYGLGANGKTTFTMVMRRLMGDYGIRLDSDDLMIKDKKSGGSSPKEGLADTRGKRYAICSEVQDGKRLDIGLLKDMTGQDTIKARRLYEHELEFLPSHKLWMFGNHKPVIRDTTNAAWRRLKLIPFSFTVPDSEIDMELPDKLEAELPGILNWAIRGCLEWQKEGFTEPHTVTDAVTAYRNESDILADFLEDCCTLEHMANIPKADLKHLYENWCKETEVDPITQRTFKSRLVEKGITDGRSADHKTRVWVGIRQKTDEDITDNSDITDKSGGVSSHDRTRDTLFTLKSPHDRTKSNTLQENGVLLSELSENSEMPDCPNCGKNLWKMLPDGIYICECGQKIQLT